MAWGTAPTTPAWKDPSLKGKYDPYYQQPQAQQTAYAQNRYQDPGFGAAAGQADKWGNKLLGQGSSMASQMQGWMNNPSALMASWGAEGWSPGHRDMAPGMAELRGGTRNMLDAGVKQMAGAGVTAGRGGFGVTGGVGPEASAQQAMIKQLAGQYGNDYMGIAGLINDSARNRGSLMSSALGAYGTGMGNVLSAGEQQGNLALGNRNALQSGQQNWLSGMADENRWNAQNYNQAMSAAQQQEAQRIAQFEAQQRNNDTWLNREQQWNAIMQRLNQPNAGQLGDGDKLRLDLLRTQMGATEPWKRAHTISQKLG